MFRKMQYNSLNAWGFIGYQLGEAVLIDAGYYSPKQVTVDGKEYDSFYMFVPDSTWAGCKTEALAEIEGSGGNKVYVTDVNRWQEPSSARMGSTPGGLAPAGEAGAGDARRHAFQLSGDKQAAQGREHDLGPGPGQELAR